MSIYTKLNTARNQFHTLKLKKSGLNKFAGYEYFELADFLIPAMDILSKNDLCAFISFGKDLATMKIVDATDSSFIEITSPMSTAALKGCHEVQQLGAVQSYLRRYLWVAALEIVEHDALDSSAPLTSKVQAIKQPALGGIGDELPIDRRDYLRELAAWITDNADDATVVREELAVQNLDETQLLYMQSFLNPAVRKALGMTYKKAA